MAWKLLVQEKCFRETGDRKWDTYLFYSFGVSSEVLATWQSWKLNWQLAVSTKKYRDSLSSTVSSKISRVTTLQAIRFACNSNLYKGKVLKFCWICTNLKWTRNQEVTILGLFHTWKKVRFDQTSYFPKFKTVNTIPGFKTAITNPGLKTAITKLGFKTAVTKLGFKTTASKLQIKLPCQTGT